MLLLIGVMGASTVALGSLPPPSTPLSTPTIDSCYFYPDPRVNASVTCQGGNALQPAYVNLTVRFLVNVSNPDPENISVTFYFDYRNRNLSGGPPTVNPDSPVRTINVTNPVPGTSIPVETNWTYGGNWTLYNFTNTGDPSTATSVRYTVLVEAANETGNRSQLFFRVTVNRNSGPNLNGLSFVYSIPEEIQTENPVIPLLYVNVSVEDPDLDPLTITWFWGDGSVRVNTTGPLVDYRLDLNVTHQYPVGLFPLNESPRFFDFQILVFVDDGAGHNVSSRSIAEFYIGFDFLPTVRVTRPAVGSVWKVGEAVAMEGNVTDPEGSAIVAYWDFDNRTDEDGDGNPTNDRDANGTTASHAYSALGNVAITLWATDGENKALCLDPVNCTANATGYQSHWTSRPVPIVVRNNLPPVLALSNGTAEKGKPFLLRATVFDGDGDNMTVTWVFDDGSANETAATGPSSRSAPEVFEITLMHTFTTVGVHNFTVVLSDGNVTVEGTTQIVVESFNLPPARPVFEALRGNGTSAGNNTFRLNETVVIRVFVSDPENDTVDIIVDWGDENISTAQVDFSTASNCTLRVSGNTTQYVCAVTFSHRYVDIGSSAALEYEVLMTATDHEEYYRINPDGGPPIRLNHAPTQAAIIIVTNFLSGGLGPWDWWDYSTLALIVGVPAAVIGRFARNVRRERREE